MAPVVRVQWLGSEEQNQGWFTAYADHLTRAGWAGSVEPLPRIGLPRPMAELADAPKLTAFLGYRMTGATTRTGVGYWGPPRWAVDSDVTADLCRHLVDWGTIPGAAVHLQQSTNAVVVDDPDVTEMLRWAAGHDHLTGVT